MLPYVSQRILNPSYGFALFGFWACVHDDPIRVPDKAADVTALKLLLLQIQRGGNSQMMNK
jgi:hypothetical protein